MEILTFISNLMIPLVIMYIVAYGLLAKTDIFDAFLKGATDGLKIVFRILPTLVGLMVAICILSESGFFNVLSVILKPWQNVIPVRIWYTMKSMKNMFAMSTWMKMILHVFYRTSGNIVHIIITVMSTVWFENRCSVLLEIKKAILPFDDKIRHKNASFQFRWG